MQYLLITTYRQGPIPVYERAATRGRMLPPGVMFVGSWIVDDDRLDRCYEVVETDDAGLLDEWGAQWSDLVAFEVLPVIDSATAAARLSIEWDGRPGPSS